MKSYPKADKGKVGSISVGAPLRKMSLSSRSLLDSHGIVTEGLDIILVNILACDLIKQQLCTRKFV